ncbi:hypothetical protein SESBI_32478 [Sesbania bispinosa]|nr:hypothetical protein SESBI_32478 [Sesbania bispinosa]
MARLDKVRLSRAVVVGSRLGSGTDKGLRGGVRFCSSATMVDKGSSSVIMGLSCCTVVVRGRQQLAAGVWDSDEGASVNEGSMRMGESVAALDEEDGGTHGGSTMPLWGLSRVVRSQRR